jgi:signal transduction histidine kinase
MEGSHDQEDMLGGVLHSAPLFIAAAHELKSPLSLVRQLSLGIDDDTMSVSEMRTLARRITLTSERALRLTTNLTRTARLEDGLFTLEPLNPVSLCQEVVDEIMPLYHERGREIIVSSRSRPLLGIANRDLLRRILLNFADNALHYSDEGGAVVVSAHAHDNGSRIRVAVRDYGPALPSTVVRAVGAQPIRMHTRPESSGLGIYIARQFAEAMQATIGTTRHKDGASFYVDIGASTQLRLW